jgi:hypothetical protein
VEHAADADVFVNVGPVDAFAGADDLKVLSLLECRTGKPPRPHERHADRAAVQQMRRDGIVGDFDRVDAGFARRDAHPRPPVKARIPVNDRRMLQPWKGVIL